MLVTTSNKYLKVGSVYYKNGVGYRVKSCYKSLYSEIWVVAVRSISWMAK